MIKPDGRIVMISGANRGIGLELVQQMQVAGYNVIGTARKKVAFDTIF